MLEASICSTLALRDVQLPNEHTRHLSGDSWWSTAGPASKHTVSEWVTSVKGSITVAGQHQYTRPRWRPLDARAQPLAFNAQAHIGQRTRSSLAEERTARLHAEAGVRVYGDILTPRGQR